MFNFTLYKYEMKGSWKTLVIFSAVLTLYITMIISMFDPATVNMLKQFSASMPEVMSAFGMASAPTDLLGFLTSYLYGMLMLVFPMVFTILRANGLVAKYVDQGSMVALVAAPVKRVAVAFTQMKVLVSGIFLIIFYCTALEIICSAVSFPGALDVSALLLLNAGLFCLQLFIGGICFLASCLFNDTKYSIGMGAGLPALMCVLQMLANTGGKAENIKYATFFTLFNPDKLVAGESAAIWGIVVLLLGAVILFTAAIQIFIRKDLHI